MVRDFDKNPHAGTNVLTEVLHNRDVKRLPVMNRNSVADAGWLAQATCAPANATLDEERYGRLAATLDVLFNFAYWHPPEANDDEA